MTDTDAGFVCLYFGNAEEYTCGGFDPADWEDAPPVEFWQIRVLLSGAAQHTYTSACDGHNAPGPCPAASAEDRELAEAETTHACPVPFSEGGDGAMPCCGRTPFEVDPWRNRITLDPALVTCRGAGGRPGVGRAHRQTEG